MDAGTFDSLCKATTVSAPEEIAYRFGWIDDDMIKASAEKYGKSPYGEHLMAVLEGKIIL